MFENSWLRVLQKAFLIASDAPSQRFLMFLAGSFWTEKIIICFDYLEICLISLQSFFLPQISHNPKKKMRMLSLFQVLGISWSQGSIFALNEVQRSKLNKGFNLNLVLCCVELNIQKKSSKKKTGVRGDKSLLISRYECRMKLIIILTLDEREMLRIFWNK